MTKLGSAENRFFEIIELAKLKNLIIIDKEQSARLLLDIKDYTRKMMSMVYHDVVKVDNMKELYDVFQIIFNALSRGKYEKFECMKDETTQTVSFIVGTIKVTFVVPRVYYIDSEPDYGIMGLLDIENPESKISFTSRFVKVGMLLLLPLHFARIDMYRISACNVVGVGHFNENKQKALIPHNYLESIHEKIKLELCCKTCGEKIFC